MLRKKFFFYSVFSILALFSSEDYTLTTKIKEYWKNTKEGITNFQDKRPVVFAGLASVIAGLGMYGSSAFALGKFFLPLDTKASSFKKALRSPFLYGTAAFSLTALYFLLKKDPDRTSFSKREKSPAPKTDKTSLSKQEEFPATKPEQSQSSARAPSAVVSNFVTQGRTYNEEDKREEFPATKPEQSQSSARAPSAVVSNFVKHGITCEEKDKLDQMEFLVFSYLGKPREFLRRYGRSFNFPAKQIVLKHTGIAETYAKLVDKKEPNTTKIYGVKPSILYMFIDIDSKKEEAREKFNEIMTNGATFAELCTFAKEYDNDPMNQRTKESLMYLLPLAHTDNPEDAPIKAFDDDKKFSFTTEELEKHRIATKINSDFRFTEEMSKEEVSNIRFFAWAMPSHSTEYKVTK